jgi:hypothetical protein
MHYGSASLYRVERGASDSSARARTRKKNALYVLTFKVKAKVKLSLCLIIMQRNIITVCEASGEDECGLVRIKIGW